jgi:hypothetical protein
MPHWKTRKPLNRQRSEEHQKNNKVSQRSNQRQWLIHPPCPRP